MLQSVVFDGTESGCESCDTHVQAPHEVLYSNNFHLVLHRSLPQRDSQKLYCACAEILA